MGNHFESSLGKTTSGLVMRKRANKRIRSLERSTVWRTSLGLTSFRRSDVCYLRCQSGRFRGNSTTRQRNWWVHTDCVHQSITHIDGKEINVNTLVIAFTIQAKLFFRYWFRLWRLHKICFHTKYACQTFRLLCSFFQIMLKFMPAQSIRASLYQGTLRCRSDFTCRLPPCDTNMYTLYTIPIGF